MKKILLILFTFSIAYSQGNSGIRSLNGSLSNSQRVVWDTTGTPNTFKITTSNGVHTLWFPYNRFALTGQGSVGNADSLGSLPASSYLKWTDTTSSIASKAWSNGRFVQSVSGTSPIVSSGGLTPTISFAPSSGSSFDSTRLAYLDKANTFTGTPQTMSRVNVDTIGDKSNNGGIVVDDTVKFNQHIGIIQTPSKYAAINYDERIGITDSLGEYFGILSAPKYHATIYNFQEPALAMIGRSYLDSLNTKNWTSKYAMVGIEGSVETELGSQGTVYNAMAFLARNRFNSLTDSIKNSYGMYIETPIDNHIANSYGIYLENHDSVGQALSYSIYSVGGKNYFGGNSLFGKYIGVDSLRNSTGSTTYWNHTGYHSGLGASYFGALDVSSLNSRGALDVNGNSIFRGTANIGSGIGGWTWGALPPRFVVYGQSGYALGLGAGGRTIDVIIDATTGNVGIGTTNPSEKLGVAGNAVFSGAISSGAITSTGLSTFGTNAGNATIGAGDSVQVTVTGLTTATGVATVCYKRGITSSATADTIASYNITSADKLTLFGKYGWTVSYTIMKK